MRNLAISQIFGLGKRSSIPKDAVGIEIEAEGTGRISDDTMIELDNNQVRATADGSLRNGIEFITSPISAASLSEHGCWKPIAKALKEMRATDNSVRTSTHVHLNMRDRTFLDVTTMAVVYWSLEQTLLRLCDKFRRGNMFALSITDSQTMLDFITNAFNSDQMPNLSNNEHKYSSFNFVPLSRYGTVEIRIMHGLTDVDKVIDWALLCNAIRVLANGFADPSEVMAVKPSDLLDRFMSLLHSENYWKFRLKEIDPTYSLALSREIMEAWAGPKSKKFWQESGNKTYARPLVDRTLEMPEMDFKYAEEPFTTVDIREDI